MIVKNLPLHVDCPDWERFADPIGYYYEAVRECGVFTEPFTMDKGERPGKLLCKVEGIIFPSPTEKSCPACFNYTLKDFRQHLDSREYYRPWMEKNTTPCKITGNKKWGCSNCPRIFSKEFQDVASNPPYCYKSSEE